MERQTDLSAGMYYYSRIMAIDSDMTMTNDSTLEWIKPLYSTAPLMDANDTDAVTLTTMQEQIEELTRTITALSAGDFRGRSRCSCDRDYGTSHHRSQSRRRSRSRPRNRELCWYHDRFGAKAMKCEPDCKWSVIEKDRLN
ncbi:hypothetical protein ACJJTC_007439 [Scirpophaga incertulas]